MSNIDISTIKTEVLALPPAELRLALATELLGWRLDTEFAGQIYTIWKDGKWLFSTNNNYHYPKLFQPDTCPLSFDLILAELRARRWLVLMREYNKDDLIRSAVKVSPKFTGSVDILDNIFLFDKIEITHLAKRRTLYLSGSQAALVAIRGVTAREATQ